MNIELPDAEGAVPLQEWRGKDASPLLHSHALGIAAASFWSEAEKDTAESPTAPAGTPKRNRYQDSASFARRDAEKPKKIQHLIN